MLASGVYPTVFVIQGVFSYGIFLWFWRLVIFDKTRLWEVRQHTHNQISESKQRFKSTIRCVYILQFQDDASSQIPFLKRTAESVHLLDLTIITPDFNGHGLRSALAVMGRHNKCPYQIALTYLFHKSASSRQSL